MTERQSTRENLKDLARNLGGSGDGSTITEIIDEIENLATAGGEAVVAADITDQDIDAIFED